MNFKFSTCKLIVAIALISFIIWGMSPRGTLTYSWTKGILITIATLAAIRFLISFWRLQKEARGPRKIRGHFYSDGREVIGHTLTGQEMFGQVIKPRRR